MQMLVWRPQKAIQNTQYGTIILGNYLLTSFACVSELRFLRILIFPAVPFRGLGDYQETLL